MVAAPTSDALLARLRTRAGVPDADARFGGSDSAVDEELLALLDEVIRTDLGLEVYQAADGRHVVEHTQALVAERSDYALPARCWSVLVDHVALLDAAGNERELHYVHRHEIGRWQYGARWPGYRFTLLGDAIRILPTPQDASLRLQLRYVRRPSKLVKLAACAEISATPTSSAITVTSFPASGWSDPVVDVVRASYHATPLEDDVALTDAGSTSKTRNSGSWTTTGALAVAAGDYLCLAGETCIPQVPEVALPYVLEQAAYKASVVMGDREAQDTHLRAAETQRQRITAAMAERSGIAPKIMNPMSPMRQASWARRGGRWRWGH